MQTALSLQPSSMGLGMDAVCPVLAMFGFIVCFFLDFGFKSSSL